MLSNIANKPLTKQGDLVSKLKFKRHARVMLNTNLDISSSINTHLGYIYDFKVN